MKKIYYTIIILFLLVAGAYLYVRYGFLKAKDFKPDNSKSLTVVDLRPAIIAKLQQLVKDGSNGLYKLSIDKIDPQLLSSKLKVVKASVTPDSAVLLKMDKERIAPDDVFKISFDSLNIDGIGIDELLHTNKIDIKKIFVSDPLIEIFHVKRNYNKAERDKNDSIDLYDRLMHGMKRISIDSILFTHGRFINHNISKKKTDRFNDVTINLNGLLIDSTTKNNHNSFLFAEDAGIAFKNYTIPTPDSLYFFKAAAVSISAAKRTLVASGITLTPRGNREHFLEKLKYRKDMFTLKASRFTLDDIDWYNILNNDKIIAKEGNIEDCDFSDYFDRRIPVSPVPKLNTFPHQLLMKMKLPVYIQKINLKNCNVKYEEFNPISNATGTIYFDKMNATLSNITNMPEYIRRNSKMKLSATALFLHKVKFNTTFNLDLKNFKNGNFSVDAVAGECDSTLINPISEPLGLISIKKGMVNKAVIHIDGTNTKGTGKVLLLYNDLHVVPLKTGKDGGLKKRSITSLLANAILIKNDNPAKGKDERSEDCDYDRNVHASYFNLIWKTILTGVLKTIGIPVKFAYKNIE